MFVGDHFYGKVDHVPGMFFVRTRFLHYLWIPVVPRESWLMRDGGSSVGVRIPLRWKSVWLAWVRTFLVAMVVTFTAVGVAFARMEPEAGKMHLGIIALIPWGIALVLAAIFVISYRFSRAGLHRAIQLGELLSIPSAEVERKFCWPDSIFDAPESREIVTEITVGLVETSASVVDAAGEATGDVLYLTALLAVTMGIACLGVPASTDVGADLQVQLQDPALASHSKKLGIKATIATISFLRTCAIPDWIRIVAGLHQVLLHFGSDPQGSSIDTGSKCPQAQPGHFDRAVEGGIFESCQTVG
jgi:hypothetical protein